MFSVELKKSAKKGLDAVPGDYKGRITDAMKFLQFDPYPFRQYDLRKVKSRENVYGIRIGKYRFLYEVFKEEKCIIVFQVGLKGETTYKF